jgi:asparagine synthase (glutamine-hydrolysing)
MCGIVGILNFNNQPVAYNQIKAMTDAIAHRGPDGEGHFIDGNLGFGHRRLAIIDLSSAGHQPMQTRDGQYIITYNGEVYNFQEIRMELQALSYHFHSRSDSEVVLNAFAEWGAHSLNKFNGMFAFAIWDKKNKRLFCARDRYGIKPFYYYKDNNYFIFSSEIKAIIASRLYQCEIDKEALFEYLTFQNFFTSKTLFKNIQILPSGHYIDVSEAGNLSLKQYWDFDFEQKLDVKENDAIQELDRLFRQAVQRQLVSDVPVNAYLSGGIDSGAITMVASQFVPHMRTFTVGFDMSSISGLELTFDERTKAEHISYLANTEHYEMVLKAGDMERCMESLVQHLEEPRVGQSYPNFYAAKLAGKFSKVVLSGAGGDELFAGYPWRYYYSSSPKTFDQFIDEYYLKWQRLIPNSSLQKLLEPIWKDIKHVWTRDIFADVFKCIRKPKLQTSAEFLNYSLYLEAKTFLHGILVVEDKLSMAHSLENRVPFLDNNLVDFALKLPSYLKIPDSTKYSVDENQFAQKKLIRAKSGKWILRKTLGRYLGDSIVDSIKQGFSAPDASWFRGKSIDYIKNMLMNKNACIYNYLDKDTTFEMLETHFSGQENKRLMIWSLLNVELFVKNYLEN